MMYEDYFVPFPLLETERLIIRQVRRSDAKELYELCRRPETSKYAHWSPHTSLYATKSYISYLLSLKRKHQLTGFVIVEKQSGKLIGTCSYVSIDEDYKTAEIGYCILKEYWGQGFAKEAVDSLLWYGFEEINLQRIYARVLPENIQSVRVLQKCGFTFEGTLRKGFYYKGQVSNVLLYAITDEDYQ